ncbi:ribonuclease H-like domain-containing protein [Tanacetum coccineum]
MAFPCLQELAAAQNSNNLSDAISVYIERKINDDLHFAAGLTLQCAEFFTQLSQTEVLKMLAIRKSIAKIRMIPIRLYLLLYVVHGDDEVGTWVAIFVVLFTQPSCTQILHQLILGMMSEERITQARETYSPQHKVLTNDDLLTQILIRLPILCIHLFATVSKQWLRIITSPLFIKTRSQITKVDPPVGLFVNHIRSLFESDFVPLDPRLRSKKSAMDRSFSRGSTEEADNVKILQSCNGLLLCGGSGMPVFYYVYNPSTNQYKKIPYADCSLDNSPYYSSAGLRIAFDPTKSPHYKLVDAGRTFCDIDI